LVAPIQQGSPFEVKMRESGVKRFVVLPK